MAERTDDGLVAAAISTLSDNYIISQREYLETYGREIRSRKHDITIGHSNSVSLSGRCTPRRFSVSQCDNMSRIYIRDIRDTKETFHPVAGDLNSLTVRDLKKKISFETGVKPSNQRLMYGGLDLEDGETLKKYGVCPEAMILLGRQKDTGVVSNTPQYLDQSDLSPEFDCDFTGVVGSGHEYRRGGRVYKRPYGWRRFALNVLGLYGSDNKWLGVSGHRTHESPGEWAVSFYGVMEFEVLKSGRGACPVKKVYSSPDIESQKFTEFVRKFSYRDSWYAVVYQNRIDTRKMSVSADGEYLICGIEDIRPYGICVKKIEKVM